MKVPILRVPFTEEEIRGIQSDVEQVLSSGMLTMGEFTRQFEDSFATFTGAGAAISCNSGTAALELILRGLGIEDRSVAVPTNTFLATALAVMHSGNSVLFADSRPDTLGLDLEDLERRIREDTAAIIPVHIGGYISPDMEALTAFADARDLHVIEDCAHAHGCRKEGRHVGRLGIAGAFSFFPTKVLTTGEGGMVITDDDALADRIRSLRNHGKSPILGGRIDKPGYNFRMSEITALLGLHQVRKADWIASERVRAAAFYDRALESIEGIKALPLAPGTTSTYYKYIAYLEKDIDRALLKKVMKEKHDVALTGEVYSELCHSEPIWDGHTYCGKKRSDKGVSCQRWPTCGCDESQSNYPGAQTISERHICLPVYPGLSEKELHHVVASLSATITELRGLN